MNKYIFTIGYSSFSLDLFIKTLKKFNITALTDVRSQPYSKFKPEFNREHLKKELIINNIEYVFLGKECGARIDAPECYVDGQVNFSLVAKNPLFIQGLKRIKIGMEKFRIALMCAEKDPINCHRTILVCRNLLSDNIKIKHILHNGVLEDHKKTEKRLMEKFKLDQPQMFITKKQRLEKAYYLQEKKIAYKDNDTLKERYNERNLKN